MSNGSFLIKSLALSAIALSVWGCKQREYNTSEVKNVGAGVPDDPESMYVPRGNPGYIYKGPVPSFSQVDMVVSVGGLTLRVEGIPDTLSEAFKAIVAPYNGNGWDDKGGRYVYESPQKNGRYFLVYPIAIGKTYQDSVRDYNWARIIPRRAPDVHSWHGLPFMGFAGNGDGSVAFHSPITSSDGPSGGVASSGELLQLYRGKVSMGCKRMHAEHVLELANIFAVDTRVPAGSSEADSGNKISSVANKRGISEKFIHVRKVFDTVGGYAVDSMYGKYGRLPDAPTKSYSFNIWDLSDEGRSDYVCSFQSKDYENCTKLKVDHSDFLRTEKMDEVVTKS